MLALALDPALVLALTLVLNLALVLALVLVLNLALVLVLDRGKRCDTRVAGK